MGNTSEKVMKRIAKDFNLNEKDPEQMAIIIAAEFLMSQGYEEAAPLLTKYKDLVCPWDGMLHRNDECDKKAREAAKHEYRKEF